MTRKVGQHGTALLDIRLRIAFAEHGLRARLVHARDEYELAAVLGNLRSP